MVLNEKNDETIFIRLYSYIIRKILRTRIFLKIYPFLTSPNYANNFKYFKSIICFVLLNFDVSKNNLEKILFFLSDRTFMDARIRLSQVIYFQRSLNITNVTRLSNYLNPSIPVIFINNPCGFISRADNNQVC